jgi:hypothetical protein
MDSKVSAGATAEFLLDFILFRRRQHKSPCLYLANFGGKKVLDIAAAPGKN